MISTLGSSTNVTNSSTIMNSTTGMINFFCTNLKLLTFRSVLCIFPNKTVEGVVLVISPILDISDVDSLFQNTTSSYSFNDCSNTCKQESLCEAATFFTATMTCQHFSNQSSLLDTSGTVLEIMNCTEETLMGLIGKE